MASRRSLELAEIALEAAARACVGFDGQNDPSLVSLEQEYLIAAREIAQMTPDDA
jgi:hypothetical protein